MKKAILMLAVSFLFIGTSIAKTDDAKKVSEKCMKKIESFEKTKDSGLKSLDSYVNATKDIATTLKSSNKVLNSMEEGKNNGSSLEELTVTLTKLPISIADLSSKGDSIIEDCKKESNPMKKAKYVKLAAKTATMLTSLGGEANYQIGIIKSIQ
ncbi:MAG: hypothetical protein IMY73_05410 [Bacteroidetes bacterium]|nr:hypothetical protein [Bacteroidota bacterium]